MAADESTGTIGKRLAGACEGGVENTEANRRGYRELLFTTPELNKHISSVIMYEETLYQHSGDAGEAKGTGVSFVGKYQPRTPSTHGVFDFHFS